MSPLVIEELDMNIRKATDNYLYVPIKYKDTYDDLVIYAEDSIIMVIYAENNKVIKVKGEGSVGNFLFKIPRDLVNVLPSGKLKAEIHLERADEVDCEGDIIKSSKGIYPHDKYISVQVL